MRLEKWTSIIKKKSIMAELLVGSFQVSYTLISTLKSEESKIKAKKLLIEALRDSIKRQEGILHKVLYRDVELPIPHLQPLPPVRQVRGDGKVPKTKSVSKVSKS